METEVCRGPFWVEAAIFFIGFGFGGMSGALFIAHKISKRLKELRGER